MAKNVYETLDDALRGEATGQLSPEGQTLWDQYQSILNAQKNAPMRDLQLKSGATMQIVDPGFGLKNRMLQKTLAGMTGTGLGTRAKPQPGALSQLAPFVTALGSDPKFQKWLANYFNGGGQIPGGGDFGTSGGDMGSGAWGTGNLTSGDFVDNVPEDIPWGWD